MRHGGKKDIDMRHGYLLNSTCDMVENKRQRHATLAGPPQGPHRRVMRVVNVV